jgi:hypothetical protein
MCRSTHHARKCRLVSSGPLSQRMAKGCPRSATIASNTRVTLRLAKLVSTSKAKHSLSTHPPRSAPGSPVRTPPHRAESPAPTPGSPKSAPPAAFPSARSVSASSSGSSSRPPDTLDARACGSHALPSGPATHAAADTQSAASPAPTPPAACATAHRCVSSGSGNSTPPSPADRTLAAR